MRRHPAATVVWIIAGLQVVRHVSDAVRSSPASLAGRTPDDAYYYLVIGRSLASWEGPTFDGYDMTNGYHPLWQSMVAVLSWLLPDRILLSGALILGAVLATGGYLLLVRTAGRVIDISPLGAALGAVVVSGPTAWERTVNGMEGAAVVAALALAVWASSRWWHHPTLSAFGLVGITSGLLCLARTSQIATIALVPVLLLWAHPRLVEPMAKVRHVAVWALGVAATTVPWFVWSWHRVGAPQSVAATMKAHWQHQQTGGLPSFDGLSATLAAGAAELWQQVHAVAPFTYDWPSLARQVLEVVVVLLVIAVTARAIRSRPASMVFIAPCAAVLARFLLELLLVPDVRGTWYSGPIFTIGALLVAVAFTDARALWRDQVAPRVTSVDRRFSAVLAVVLAGLAAVLVSHRPASLDRTWGEANWSAAQELRQVPPQARVGSFDTGSLGFVRPGVVNLDGLVRGPAYVERLIAAERPSDVVLEEELDYLVGRLEPGDVRLPSCARPVWSSPEAVSIGGRLEPVRIWSLHACGVRPGSASDPAFDGAEPPPDGG